MKASGAEVANRSSGVGPQQVRAEGLGDREHVGVRVHRDLGPAGRAGGGREQRDVVGGGLHVGEAGRLSRRAADEVVVGGTAERDDAQRGVGGQQLVEQARVADGEVGTGQLAQGPQLGGAQHRHRQHDDAAGLEHSQPGRDGPGVVGGADEHPVARDQAEVVDEHARERVRPPEQLAVGPRLVGRDQGAAFGVRERGGQQHGGRVDLRGSRQPRHGQQLGPGLARREAVAAERVDVGADGRLHRTSREDAGLPLL